jgi:hypothetical protein
LKQIKAGGSRKFLLVFFSIVALAILATAVITLPKATATLNVAASDFKKDYTVTAQKSTSLSIDKKMIPATVVEVDKESTKSYPATGTQDAGTKATGKVTITNKYSSSAVFIAQGTILTSAGQNFVLSAAVTVPGDAVTLVNGSIVETPGTVDASVTAQATGEAGNLAPSTFSVAKYSSKLLYATSTVAFTGGTTKTLHLVTDDDLANAQIALQKDITTAGATDVTAKANQGSLKIDTSKIDSEILSVTPNQKAGDQVDTFTLDMRLSLFAVGFVEKDLQSLTLSLAKADIGPNKMLLNADQNQVTYSVTDTDVNNGIIKITSTFTGKTGSKLDLDQIKDKITAKSKSSALKYLQSVDGIKSANLTVWPSFLKMTPVLGSRIKVNFDYTK